MLHKLNPPKRSHRHTLRPPETMPQGVNGPLKKKKNNNRAMLMVIILILIVLIKLIVKIIIVLIIIVIVFAVLDLAHG